MIKVKKEELVRSGSRLKLLCPETAPLAQLGSPPHFTLKRQKSLVSIRSNPKLTLKKVISKPLLLQEKIKSDQFSMQSTNYPLSRGLLKRTSERQLYRLNLDRKQEQKQELNVSVRMPMSCRIYRQRKVFSKINPQILSNITECPQQLLHALSSLEIRFDFAKGLLLDLPLLLPNLVELNISDSNLSSLRALGTGFCKLKVLWVSRNQLSNLDFINCFLDLQELFANYNQIKDLESLSYHLSLKSLDLEGNSLACFDELRPLETLQLQRLELANNPVSKCPQFIEFIKKLGLQNVLDLQEQVQQMDMEESSELIDTMMRSGLFDNQAEITQGVQMSHQSEFEHLNEMLRKRISLEHSVMFQSEESPFEWVDKNYQENPLLSLYSGKKVQSGLDSPEVYHSHISRYIRAKGSSIYEDQGTLEKDVEPIEEDEDLIRELDQLGDERATKKGVVSWFSNRVKSGS